MLHRMKAVENNLFEYMLFIQGDNRALDFFLKKQEKGGPRDGNTKGP